MGVKNSACLAEGFGKARGPLTERRRHDFRERQLGVRGVCFGLSVERLPATCWSCQPTIISVLPRLMAPHRSLAQAQTEYQDVRRVSQLRTTAAPARVIAFLDD